MKITAKDITEIAAILCHIQPQKEEHRNYDQHEQEILEIIKELQKEKRDKFKLLDNNEQIEIPNDELLSLLHEPDSAEEETLTEEIEMIQIERLTAENEELRREIARLKKQVEKPYTVCCDICGEEEATAVATCECNDEIFLCSQHALRKISPHNDCKTNRTETRRRQRRLRNIHQFDKPIRIVMIE